MSGLDRFVGAQASVYARALAELRAGHKTSHWMWFVFPQIAGLGRSEMARFYAIDDLAEARAYLAHPVLGARLIECTQTLLTHVGVDPVAIMGPIDSLKLRSSMTLFEEAAAEPAPFGAVLDAFFGGERDVETLKRLAVEH